MRRGPGGSDSRGRGRKSVDHGGEREVSRFKKCFIGMMSAALEVRVDAPGMYIDGSARCIVWSEQPAQRRRGTDTISVSLASPGQEVESMGRDGG